VDRLVSTERAGHAGQIAVEHLFSTEKALTIVLGSGDGTFHEVINALSAALPEKAASLPASAIRFVLVPCGTANALYSSLFPPSSPSGAEYRLQSLNSFIHQAKTVSLTLAVTTLSQSPASRSASESTPFAIESYATANVCVAIVSSVVISTCLHASILRDSDVLRAAHPGIERFKIAAANNSTKWYSAHAKLLPTLGIGAVQQYNLQSKSFQPHPDVDDHGIVDVYGPFLYFLSTVNVDRLEPQFKITPLASTMPPSEAGFDIVMIRPLRDPSLSMQDEEARNSFARKLSYIFRCAYSNGSHVDLRYNTLGEIVSEGPGLPVIEYIRCGGWEWVPVRFNKRQ
jgi:hypothetical protein